MVTFNIYHGENKLYSNIYMYRGRLNLKKIKISYILLTSLYYYLILSLNCFC